jgi:endonuclease/exonuclease/phosphatase family metal-dependent hydrolase
MRALLVAWLLGLAAACGQLKVVDVPVPAHSRTLPEQGGVVLAAWNVAWFPGMHPTKATPQDRERQVAAAAAEVAAVNPHILLAFEIRDEAALRRLAPGRAFYHCTQIVRPPDENPDLPNQGLALAAKTPPRACWVLDFSSLPQTPDRPVRGILGGEFATADGGRLVVYGVHLKSNRGDAATNRLRRLRAIQALCDDWERRGYDPARDRLVVAGDFNTSASDPQFDGERTLAVLEEAGMVRAGQGLPREASFSVAGSGMFPPNDFDHIFVSKAQAERMGGSPPWLVVRPFVPAASDHAMLVIKLR